VSQEDQHELTEHVAGLPTALTDSDIDAKRFDLLCLRIQLAMVRGEAIDPLRRVFVALVHALEAKASIPAVARMLVLIEEVQTSLVAGYDARHGRARPPLAALSRPCA